MTLKQKFIQTLAVILALVVTSYNIAFIVSYSTKSKDFLNAGYGYLLFYILIPGTILGFITLRLKYWIKLKIRKTLYYILLSNSIIAVIFLFYFMGMNFVMK